MEGFDSTKCMGCPFFINNELLIVDRDGAIQDINHVNQTYGVNLNNIESIIAMRATPCALIGGFFSQSRTGQIELGGNQIPLYPSGMHELAVGNSMIAANKHCAHIFNAVARNLSTLRS